MLPICHVTREPATMAHGADGASNHFDEIASHRGLSVTSAARGTEPPLTRDLHVTRVDLPHRFDRISVQPHEYLVLFHRHVSDSPVEVFLLGGRATRLALFESPPNDGLPDLGGNLSTQVHQLPELILNPLLNVLSRGCNGWRDSGSQRRAQVGSKFQWLSCLGRELRNGHHLGFWYLHAIVGIFALSFAAKARNFDRVLDLRLPRPLSRRGWRQRWRCGNWLVVDSHVHVARLRGDLQPGPRLLLTLGLGSWHSEWWWRRHRDIDWQDRHAVGLAVANAAASGASVESKGTGGTGEPANRSASNNTGLLIGATEFGRNPSHGGWIKVAGRAGSQTLANQKRLHAAKCYTCHTPRIQGQPTMTLPCETSAWNEKLDTEREARGAIEPSIYIHAHPCTYM